MGNAASRVAVIDVFLVRAQEGQGALVQELLIRAQEGDGSYTVTLAILKCL